MDAIKNIDVVIISWAKNDELLKITKDGLDTLFESDNGDIAFHAYVVESNSDVDYDEYNQKLWMHTCTTIHPTVPFGYHRYLNIGRRAGNSPYIVLCNSDLTYKKGWASEIIRAMDQFPDILSASPWCPQTLGDNTPHLNKIFKGYKVRVELSGWCIFQQRSIYNKIDELNEGVDFWYSDNLYANELQLRSISHVLVANSVVNHHEKQIGKTGSSLSEEEQIKITIGEEQKYVESLMKLKTKIRNEHIIKKIN